MVDKFSVVLVDLNPAKGSEMQKVRPCVVVSPTDLNQMLHTVQIAPLTGTMRGWAFRPVVQGKKECEVAVDQIRAIDKSRIIKKVGDLTSDEADSVQTVLTAFYGK